MFFNYGAPKGAARNGQMGAGRSQRGAGTSPRADMTIVSGYLGKSGSKTVGSRRTDATIAADGTVTLVSATGRARPERKVVKTTEAGWNDAARTAVSIISGSASVAGTGRAAGTGSSTAGRTGTPSSGNKTGTAHLAGTIAAKNNADAAATKAEVKSAKTPAERKALNDKLNAQKKAADAAAKVKQAALVGDAKKLKDAIAAQKRAEMDKVKAEARARAEAEKAQREAEAKPLVAIGTIVPSKPGESAVALAARANAAASQKLATYPTGVKFPSAKNGRIYEVRYRRAGEARENYIFVTYPDGTSKNVFGSDTSFAIVFSDLENAVAVANLREQTVVETTGSTTGDVVTAQDTVGADAVFVPSGAETVAGSTDGSTVVAASDTTLSSGGGTMTVTDATSTSDYTPATEDTVPGQTDEATVIRASETALATEAQAVVAAAVTATDAATDAAAEGTTVSTPEAVATTSEEGFLLKYKWPLVGVGVALGLWALSRK